MNDTHCRDLLCGEGSSDQAIERVLSPAGFSDGHAACRRLQRMASDPKIMELLSSFLPHLLTTLAHAADPDRVLVNLERFADGAADRLATFHYLADTPRAIEVLVTLFAGSQFLTEILLRNPEYLSQLVEHKRLAQPKSVAQLRAEARTAMASTAMAPLDALRQFQRWEFLRIGTCDLLDLFDLPTVTGQLSNLADSLVQTCLSLVTSPARQARSEPGENGFTVIAMGKLGGSELNYSSDIDLLFLTGTGTTGHWRTGEKLIDALSRVTTEGFLYRVDMRLRPWGQVGALVSSLDGYVGYLKKHARPWEKQALLKARTIAGNERVGREFLRRTRPLLFESRASSVRESVRAMKERTEANLRQRGQTWGEVKLGEGSIRDVEFVTQYMQLVHGADRPQICSHNTLHALGTLSAHDLLPPEEYRVLADGYVFLRTIEHHLQMMHYRQTHALPDDPRALAHLARRLGFQGQQAGAQFIARYEQHRAAIRAVYLHYLGSDEMKAPAHSQASPQNQHMRHHVARMDPSYTATFGEHEIELHAALAEQIDNEHLVEVHARHLEDESWRVTVVAYDYPGELSLICGLLFVYGFSIQDGDVFTYEPVKAQAVPAAQVTRRGRSRRRSRAREDTRRKIVDVFTVNSVQSEVPDGTWTNYADDLADLLQLMHHRQRRQARMALAKRVAAVVGKTADFTGTLYPVDIEIDNDLSEPYTVLRIDAPDTIGFLYELTNALAFNRIYIARVEVDSVGNQVQDILYVTDAHGNKVTDPDKQHELRTATVLIKHFTHLLPHSPNPESALLHFREFIAQLFQRPDWPNELASLERPEVLHALAQLLGVSDFLWDDFLRMQHANLFPVVRDVDALETAKSRAQLQAELEAILRPVHDGPQTPAEDALWKETINAFKDREMFRIDMRHILEHTTEFWHFSAELTDLAEVIVNATYHLCHQDLRTQYGTPHLENGDLSEMSVCALGKCGGRELGFASDIELMFIYSGNGKTSGPHPISTSEFYEKLVQIFVSVIRAKREGIFEIDLRLRPYGRAGSMAVSLESFRRYFGPGGPAWAYERQALVKLRPIAGNIELGRHIAALRDQFVYDGEPFDVTAMRAMRERQIRHLVHGGTFNAKFSPGGLVDVEYLVQGLLITHGCRDPSLRLTNIRQAMAALADGGILSKEDYPRLRKAHTFLRWLIDALRVVRGNAKDLTVPPAGSEEFAFLARRLRYGDDVERLREDLAQYATSVQELSTRLLEPDRISSIIRGKHPSTGSG